jgi:hypothetical protein
MAGLGDLIKKQKGLSGGPTQVAANAGTQSSTSEPARSSVEPTASDSIPQQPEPARPTQAPAGNKLAGLARLKLAGSRPADAGGSRDAVPALAEKPVAADDVPDESASISADLDSLDAISSTTLGEAVRAETPTLVMPDLVDVQVPERDLPADITTDQKAFIDQLDQIYSIVYDPELFGQFIRVIMQELQEHPEYIKLMAPEDTHVMIRGLRETMGLAQIKKESTKRKSTTEARAKKAPKASEFDAILDSMNLNLGDE